MHSQQLQPVRLYRYFFGTAEFNEARFELLINGLPVAIERRPLSLLAKILEHADQVVTKSELLQTVWDGRITVENVLANAIAKLRKCLGENGQLLITIPRVGYRLKGPVQKMEAAVGCDIIPRLDHNLCNISSPLLINRIPLSPPPLSDIDVIPLKPVKDVGCSNTLNNETTKLKGYWIAETPIKQYPSSASLGEWARQHQLSIMPIERRLDLFMSLAREVSMQHTKGSVHSFLSPDTVLVNQDGEVRINAPVGSAFASRAEEHFHHVSCSCFYRAPETYRNYAVSQRSDIYSLGVILYQILVADFSRPLLPDWRQDLTNRPIQHTIEAATHSCPSLRPGSVEELVKPLSIHRAGHNYKLETSTMTLASMCRQ